MFDCVFAQVGVAFFDSPGASCCTEIAWRVAKMNGFRLDAIAEAVAEAICEAQTELDSIVYVVVAKEDIATTVRALQLSAEVGRGVWSSVQTSLEFSTGSCVCVKEINQ
jgi:orotate phosphoribosyltransferase-like protein